MDKQLSTFVKILKDKQYAILLNTTNYCIVKFPCEQIDYINKTISITKSEKDKLSKLGFFVKDEIIAEKVMNVRSLTQSTLHIIISFTQECNLSCKYCSQYDSKDFGLISEEILIDIVNYVQSICEKFSFKNIQIDLFGGEPLLAVQRIFFLKDLLESSINIPVFYTLETNGLGINKSIINSFKNLKVFVTLSSLRDHDQYRVTHDGGYGTYNEIIRNLIDVNNLFDDHHSLCIRYNVNEENKKLLREFLEGVNLINLNYSEIQIAYTYEFNNPDFINRLSYDEYKKWYIDEAIDILLEYNIKIYMPNITYSSCMAYQLGNLKIFPDGKVGMCNAFKYKNRNLNLADILNDINIFEKSKNKESVLDEKCLHCEDLLFCGGKFFCKKPNYCDYFDMDIDSLLLKYISKIGTEKEKLFII
ncbi:MAG: 4Fe-4S cluster-binding domain-containing protein [Clostridiales bacterium]|jgi:uncharacterized protein|nr:4Fe-4S cluster-binding domain-containing protein [Clostridiales bacterium]